MLSRQLRDSKTPTACKELETQSPPRQWTHARLSSTCEVVPVVETIIAEMSALGYSERDIFCMRLAIEEAIVNGLLHGNKSDPTKQVRVRYQVRPDHVLTEVEDEGH